MGGPATAATLMTQRGREKGEKGGEAPASSAPRPSESLAAGESRTATVP
jgi:hypothetical protein